MKNTFESITEMNAGLAEFYYGLLSDDYNERDGVAADAEDWERRLALCLYYAELAQHG